MLKEKIRLGDRCKGLYLVQIRCEEINFLANLLENQNFTSWDSFRNNISSGLMFKYRYGHINMSTLDDPPPQAHTSGGPI